MTHNRERWQADFDAAPHRKADFATMSGVPVDPVYGPDDGEFPGQYPYVRGPYASMYRSKPWTMRMFAGFGTAVDTNRRFHDLLAAGGDGLSTAFDLPTLMGRDSDDALALGEVGRCGVAVDTLADVEDLYRGHRSRRGDDVDDDQRPGGDRVRDVRRQRRGIGSATRADRRHAPERHPQGVPGAEGVHLPAAARRCGSFGTR